MNTSSQGCNSGSEISKESLEINKCSQGCNSGSENSKESFEISTSSRCNSVNSTESTDVQNSTESTDLQTSQQQCKPSGKVLIKDSNYRERRLKNNLAAKKSRDAKRQREIAINMEVALLRAENAKLKQALSDCPCMIQQDAAAVYYSGPYNFPVVYQNPQYILVPNDLRR